MKFEIQPIFDGQGGTAVATYKVVKRSYTSFNTPVFTGTYIECINFVNKISKSIIKIMNHKFSLKTLKSIFQRPNGLLFSVVAFSVPRLSILVCQNISQLIIFNEFTHSILISN